MGSKEWLSGHSASARAPHFTNEVQHRRALECDRGLP